MNQVLTYVNADECRATIANTAKSILREHDGMISKKYLDEQLVEFALNTICDENGKLSATKVSNFIALSLLIEKAAKKVQDSGIDLDELRQQHAVMMQEKLPVEALKDLK